MTLTTRLLLVAVACVAAAGLIAFGAPAAVVGPVTALIALLLVVSPGRDSLTQALRAVSTRQEQPRAVRIISRIGLGAATMAIGAAAAGVALKNEPADVTAVISSPEPQAALPLEPVTQLARRPREKATPTPTPTPTPEGTVAPVVPAAKPSKSTPTPQPTKAPPGTPTPSTPPQAPVPPDPTPTEDDSTNLLELLFGKHPKP